MNLFKKHFKIICLSIFLIINIFIFYVIHSKHFDRLRIVFLDIGQGDSILIESPTGNQILIDGGLNRKVLEALGREIPFYDRSIDAVIATHPDADHIGGLPFVLKRYRVGNYFDNGMTSDTSLFEELDKEIVNKKISYFKATQGMLIDIGGGAYLRILYPVVNTGDDTNKNSIVAKLYFGGASILLTGDAPLETENILVKKYGKELESDILKVAHHGSKYSLSEAFISAVSPVESIISVNRDNRYGHPNIEVLDFLKEIKSEVLQTYEEGNIVFESDGYSLKRIK
ncbi:MAG: ComEC/Rec2 family competence protein [Candidatus Paceibacterota bacterium]|jgi:competence protein ComEC